MHTAVTGIDSMATASRRRHTSYRQDAAVGAISRLVRITESPAKLIILHDYVPDSMVGENAKRWLRVKMLLGERPGSAVSFSRRREARENVQPDPGQP